MPEITIDGNTYTCNEISITRGDEEWLLGSSNPVPRLDHVHLDQVTHINGYPTPVDGGTYTTIRKAHTINLDTEETA